MCADGKQSIQPTELEKLNALVEQYTAECFAAFREADRQIEIAMELSLKVSDLQKQRDLLLPH